VIEQSEQADAHFRSLRDPIDTSTPESTFSLQDLGAVALERALISERTKAGIKAAKNRGKLLGNPDFRERQADAITKASRTGTQQSCRSDRDHVILAAGYAAHAVRSSIGRRGAKS